MRYRQLSKREQKWAPFEWAWKCNKCPEVTWLDGSIDVDEMTQEKKQQKRNRSDLFRSVRCMIYPAEKVGSENKKRPGVEPWALPNDESLAVVCRRDESLTIVVDPNIVSIGAIREIENEITEKEREG